MPELPEVEVCRLNIIEWLREDPITKLTFHDPTLLKEGAADQVETALLGVSNSGWRRQGKVLLWDHPQDGILAVHLRMTGRMSHVQPNSHLPRHTRASFQLKSGAQMAFVDVRRLGTWWWGKQQDVEDWSGCTGHGPDALLQPLEPTELLERMGNSRRPLKTVLLDQSVLAGIGNIAASEVCFRAQLDPRTPITSLKPAHAVRLAIAIKEYLADSIERDRGTEIVYQGEKDSLNPFEIYGKAGLPCPNCKSPIHSAAVGGRNTFWCENCQE